MTHTETERRPLALQASIINLFTNRFLGDAGIASGMRVLDFACGVGDVALMVGRLVGDHGSVIGIDIDPDALAIATARAKEEGLDHVRSYTLIWVPLKRTKVTTPSPRGPVVRGIRTHFTVDPNPDGSVH